MDKSVSISATAETLVDVDTAASILHLKRSTLYALTSRRQVPHYKRRGRLYFLESELIAWLMAGRRDVISANSAIEHESKRRGVR